MELLDDIQALSELNVSDRRRAVSAALKALSKIDIESEPERVPPGVHREWFEAVCVECFSQEEREFARGFAKPGALVRIARGDDPELYPWAILPADPKSEFYLDVADTFDQAIDRANELGWEIIKNTGGKK